MGAGGGIYFTLPSIPSRRGRGRKLKAAQKGPDAFASRSEARVVLFMYVAATSDEDNAADGPFSAACYFEAASFSAFIISSSGAPSLFAAASIETAPPPHESIWN